MSTTEFLSRWSHRKRRAPALVNAADARGLSPPSILDQSATRHGSTESASVQTVRASDLPNLVPLEAIGAETDIRVFLAAGVPSELTRAALRRAWLSDRKIRDFVGLADYAWDFNTPESMAGFGMIEAADQVERELARLVRGAAAATTSETPVSPTPIGTLQPSEDGHSAKSGEPSDLTQPNGRSTFDEGTGPAPRLGELADGPFHRQRSLGRALPKSNG
jgi:hypothetical protein